MHGQRVALVSGAAGGIGAATAEELLEAGYYVVMIDLNEELLADSAERLSRLGTVLPIVLDVTDEHAVHEAVSSVGDDRGRIDALVNNAGAISRGAVQGMTLADWQRGIDVNLTSQFLMARAALPYMDGERKSSIVNVSSSSGKRAAAGTGSYAAAKFGVIGFTQSLALDLADRGIRVNAVCPARVETPLAERFRGELAAERGIEPDAVQAEWDSAIPLGRSAEPAEVASVVCWLLSDGASYLTGQSINVSGGAINH